MASLLQELGVLDTVVSDLAAFAAGEPIPANIDGYDATVVHLPNGPVAPYITISGSFLSILLTALTEYATFASGQPIYLAIKEGNTWYGLTLAKPANSSQATTLAGSRAIPPAV